MNMGSRPGFTRLAAPLKHKLLQTLKECKYKLEKLDFVDAYFKSAHLQITNLCSSVLA